MSSIKRELVSGVFYTSLAKYSSYAVQLVVSAILARILTPEDYGIVAIAVVFIAFFNLLSDIGIGPAIIQFKDLSHSELSQIFSFTGFLGLSVAFLFFLCSWPIAYYYENTNLVYVCQLLSLTILFYCLNIVPQNIQYREKNFKFTATVTLASNMATAVLAITFALLGFGVYALVFQQIFSIAIVFLIFYYKSKLSFVFKFNIAPLKKIFSYSIYQFLFNLINYFSRNLDKLLIGRYIGLSPLGHYEKSYNMMMLPLQNITFAVTPVLQPVFSSMQNNLQEMAEKYKKVFTLLCFIGFPLSTLLFFIGKELILLFFGNQWYDAILPFRILALTVGLQVLNGTSGSIYQSANATKQLFISGCWCGFFMVTSFAVTIIGWGTIKAVAIGYLVAQLFNSAQTYYLLFKTLHYPIKSILRVMIYPIMLSLIIGTCLFVSYQLLENINMLLSLSLKVVIALLIWYVGVNFNGPYKGMVNVQIEKLWGRFARNGV